MQHSCGFTQNGEPYGFDLEADYFNSEADRRIATAYPNCGSTFLVKDLSGRGASVKHSEANIRSLWAEAIEEDEELSEWLESAEIGDEYRLNTEATKLTRIS